MYLKSQKTIHENVKIIFCPPNVWTTKTTAEDQLLNEGFRWMHQYVNIKCGLEIMKFL